MEIINQNTMKTLTTILALILSLTASAQITGTWQLVKSFDTYNMEWELPPDPYQVHITQLTPDTLQYTVITNGNTYRGKTHVSGNNPKWIKTDFVWNVRWKTRAFMWQDTLTTHLELYDTKIYYWKKVPFVEKLTGLNDDPVISAKVYPNPATDYINLPFEASIINHVGQTLMTGAGRVDISHLPNGIFFAKSLEDRNLIIKFVKQ